jgi:hypothetical protein
MIVNEWGSECGAGRNWFGYCCGARYRPKATAKTLYATYRGIRVAPGKVGRPVNTPGRKDSLHHVETKNGFITIKIREVW